MVLFSPFLLSPLLPSQGLENHWSLFVEGIFLVQAWNIEASIKRAHLYIYVVGKRIGVDLKMKGLGLFALSLLLISLERIKMCLWSGSISTVSPVVVPTGGCKINTVCPCLVVIGCYHAKALQGELSLTLKSMEQKCVQLSLTVANFIIFYNFWVLSLECSSWKTTPSPP